MSGGRGCGEDSNTSDWQCAFNTNSGVWVLGGGCTIFCHGEFGSGIRFLNSNCSGICCLNPNGEIVLLSKIVFLPTGKLVM